MMRQNINKPHHCYKITNLVNGKLYIGVTHKDIETRFWQHAKISHSNNKIKTSINYAMIKYGVLNFIIEKLETFTDGYSAFEAEKEYIKKFNSNDYKYGYNETNGGDSGPIIFKYSTDLISNILNDYCEGIKIEDISKKYNLSYNKTFDITRLRFSELYNIPNELINRLKEAKLNSKKRKRTTKTDIINIINDFLKNTTASKLSDKYKLSVFTIWNILHRQTWKNITLDEELENKLKEKISSISRKNLTKAEAQEILNSYCAGTSIKELSKKFSISNNIIRLILKRNTFKDLIIPIEEAIYYEKIKQEFHYKTINNSEVPVIFTEYINCRSIMQVARIFNVSRYVIYSILRRIRYSYVSIDSNTLQKVNEILTSK